MFLAHMPLNITTLPRQSFNLPPCFEIPVSQKDEQKEPRQCYKEECSSGLIRPNCSAASIAYMRESLRMSHLGHQRSFAELQTEILSCYAHMIRSISGRQNHVVFPDKRQRELFKRCLKKATANSSKKDDSENCNNPNQPAVPQNSRVLNKLESPQKGQLSVADAISAAAHSSSIKLRFSNMKLEGRAASFFRSVPSDQQHAALSFCDEAALEIIRQGNTVQKPVPFFKAALERFVKNQPPKGEVPVTVTTAPKQEGQIELQKQRQPDVRNIQLESQQQRKRSSSPPVQTKLHPTKLPQANTNQEINRKKSSKTNPTRIQILQKNNNQNRAPKAVINSMGNELVEELRRELHETKSLLETRTQKWRDEVQNNKALKKMWEQEQYYAKASKDRIQKLEDDIQGLRRQLVDKDAEVEEQLEESKQIIEKQKEEQSDYKEMVATFTRMSKELCNMQQEKREVEKALETQKNLAKAKNAELIKLRATIKMLRPTAPNNRNFDGDRKIARLKRELTETQDKLAKERDRNANRGNGKKPSSKSGPREKPSLADFVLGNASNDDEADRTSVQILTRSASEDSTGVHVDSNVQILQRIRSASIEANPFADHPASNNDHNNNDDVNTSLEVELPTESRTTCQEQQVEPENISINFHGIDRAYDSQDEEDNAGDRIKTEIDFLVASFGDDELEVQSDPDRIIRKLQLHCDRNHEIVDIDLLLTIREGYPEAVPLEVEASLSPETNPSVEARKIAMDALPGLVDMCRWEANGSVGNESLFSVLQIADQWVQNEWHGIQSKRLAADLSGKPCLPPGDVELSRLLISSHHIVDNEKTSFVKNMASKYDLGGFIKTGYPGYVLIEGMDDNCTFFVETLLQQRMKLRNNSKAKKTDSATFKVAGKVTIKVEDLDSSRTFPKKVIVIEHSKEGMEILQQESNRVGLDNYLDS